MTPQTKWHDHAQDIDKTAIKNNKSPKYQKHKIDNRCHDSIPMVPSDSKGKLNLGLL